VLIDDENRACLGDFGFAGIRIPPGLAGASSLSDVGGTAIYMAPELLIHQANKGQSSVPLPKEPADIYAFGMLIYEVLSCILYNNGTS
jgi:serine/threonine protein kinase